MQQYTFLAGSTCGSTECAYRSAAFAMLPMANQSSEEGSCIKRRPHAGLPRTAGRSRGSRVQKEAAAA
ncbi:hypothetical protein BHE74_00040699 [Ensete ventricosum]|nr:hypothetical protein GW17_00041350 [Ensete ventricosum]RWW52854.1 hypothetical protein BHE74_00040699 [Ensete ventricosum]RZS12172.1 hypothetical protein BHM03_00043579 [Ensete ventricosum]